MKRKMLILFVGFMLTAGVCLACDSANQKVEDVSLMQLIVNPDPYHGKLVRVTGVSKIEFEGDSVWFTTEHYKHGIYKNSLWIEPDYDALGATRKQLESFNGKYVLMEGFFNKENLGHLGMYSGALEKVARFQLWEKEHKTSQPDESSTLFSKKHQVLSVQLHQPFAINIHQLAELNELGFRLSFQEVLEDSRCPSNVECAEAGQARISIDVSGTGKDPTTLELNTNPPLQQDVAAYEDIQIRLLALNPYPEDIDQNIPADT